MSKPQAKDSPYRARLRAEVAELKKQLEPLTDTKIDELDATARTLHERAQRMRLDGEGYDSGPPGTHSSRIDRELIETRGEAARAAAAARDARSKRVDLQSRIRDLRPLIEHEADIAAAKADIVRLRLERTAADEKADRMTALVGELDRELSDLMARHETALAQHAERELAARMSSGAPATVPPDLAQIADAVTTKRATVAAAEKAAEQAGSSIRDIRQALDEAVGRLRTALYHRALMHFRELMHEHADVVTALAAAQAVTGHGQKWAVEFQPDQEAVRRAEVAFQREVDGMHAVPTDTPPLQRAEAAA